MGCCLLLCEKGAAFASESGGAWAGSAKTLDKKAKLEQLLVQPWEASEQGVDVMFPLEAMDRDGSIPDGQSAKAGTSKTATTIHLTMRNSATNKIEDGYVIVDPKAPMAEIVKFVSMVQSCSEIGGIDMKDSMISWTSMGLQKESAFDTSMPATPGGFDFSAMSAMKF